MTIEKKEGRKERQEEGRQGGREWRKNRRKEWVTIGTRKEGMLLKKRTAS
jgi:hypothetical protein